MKHTNYFSARFLPNVVDSLSEDFFFLPNLPTTASTFILITYL